MINGAHFLLYSRNPEADRAFFRDVLEFRSVDAGHGWLLLALPPTELAVHPADNDSVKAQASELYLMCDDLPAVIKTLNSRGVTCSEVETARWGAKTTIPLPSGAMIGLYQPAHPTAISVCAEAS